MKPTYKLILGSVLAGVGLVLIMRANRELIADAECVDCDETTLEDVAQASAEIEVDGD
jgi:hypothetical protein